MQHMYLGSELGPGSEAGGGVPRGKEQEVGAGYISAPRHVYNSASSSAPS